MKTYTLEITEAENGWIVTHRPAPHGPGYVAYAAHTFVVPQGEDLSKYIAAAITTGKMEDDSSATSRSLGSLQPNQIWGASSTSSISAQANSGAAGEFRKKLAELGLPDSIAAQNKILQKLIAKVRRF